MSISITKSEVRKVTITYLAKVEDVSKVRARVYLFRQVFYKKVKKERVNVGVKHLDSLTECVFQKRVKCVPVKKYENFNFIHVNTKIEKLHTSLACCNPTLRIH